MLYSYELYHFIGGKIFIHARTKLFSMLINLYCCTRVDKSLHPNTLLILFFYIKKSYPKQAHLFENTRFVLLSTKIKCQSLCQPQRTVVCYFSLEMLDTR